MMIRNKVEMRRKYAIVMFIMKTNGLRQIAKKAGCSCATVSRVLNNRQGISDAVRKKILALAGEMKYTGTPGKRNVTLFANLDVDGFDIYTMHLLHEVMIELHRAEFRVEVLFDSDVEMSGERYICGAVSLLPYDRIASIWGKKRNQPLVCINDYSDFPGGVPSVCSDDRKAIRDAVDFLYGKGHRFISLLVTGMDTLNNLVRVGAFEAYTAEYKGQLRSSVIRTESRFLNAVPLEQYVEKLPADCTAVIAPVEAFGNRLYRILKAQRPETELIPWCYPQHDYAAAEVVPSMQQDFRSLAKTAVKMLLDQLQGTSVSNSFVPYIFHHS
mgnify:CR=1 FL=1